MTEQLDRWESQFGDDYTERNRIDWSTRFRAWEKMLSGLSLNHVVEVGPNRGHNLRAIHETGIAAGNLIGIEPNISAVRIARQTYPEVAVLQGNAFRLPLIDAYADLVFTAGVLIHISSDDLPHALSEIYRVSRRYILCIEYYAEEETPIQYRGYKDLLWKRDFRQRYQDQFPDLNLTREGYWSVDDGFDRTHWWLFEK